MIHKNDKFEESVSNCSAICLLRSVSYFCTTVSWLEFTPNIGGQHVQLYKVWLKEMILQQRLQFTNIHSPPPPRGDKHLPLLLYACDSILSEQPVARCLCPLYSLNFHMQSIIRNFAFSPWNICLLEREDYKLQGFYEQIWPFIALFGCKREDKLMTKFKDEMTIGFIIMLSSLVLIPALTELSFSCLSGVYCIVVTAKYCLCLNLTLFIIVMNILQQPYA